MTNRTIDGLLLREMFQAGTALLEANREAVDALNVFPVPDGDTGTNMSLTAMAAVREMNGREVLEAGIAAESMAKGALRGARGNSGVILSQLLRGFARGVEGVSTITAEDYARGLRAGVDMAYKAVMKPKEGTMLTVSRIVAEAAEKQAAKAPNDLGALLSVVLTSGEAILKRTPEMLPQLKAAGVVDAGGRGLLLLYAGMNAAFKGEPVLETTVSSSDDGVPVYDDDHDAISDIKYAYCTEFFISNLKPEVTDEQILTLRRRFNRIGDCVLVVGDPALVKVHLHTNDPGKALQAALTLGELSGMKIENMLDQRRELDRKRAEAQPPKPYGMVSVSMGDGFEKIFKDLGVDVVVDGGQTMNPSIDDLTRAIQNVKADAVFVLPNNSNIILAATQAASLIDRPIYVIPTKNVAMGFAAVIACQEGETPEENVQRMTEAASHVKTGMVTRAIRDSQFDELTIHEGDAIGLCNGAITVCKASELEAAEALLPPLVTDDDSLITVFYGQGVPVDEAQSLADAAQERYPHCDVELHSGGQPVYAYIVSVE